MLVGQTKKILNSNAIQERGERIDANQEFVRSFNASNCLTKDTKLVIVGTITPPKGNGYFYTAPRNRIYGYIDAHFGNTELKDLKSKLSNVNFNSVNVVDDIKKTLIQRKIAFLDVFEYVIRKTGSSSDSDIDYVSLDCDSFAQIPAGAGVICNSRLAEWCYNMIKGQNSYLPTGEYCSQRFAKKVDWINTIKKYI